MHTRSTLAVAAVLVFLLNASMASAVIVHHCDYGTHTSDVHEDHDDGTWADCDNTDPNGAGYQVGECEHSSSFYWTFGQCSGSYCQVTGTIDCPGGDKSYSMTCYSTPNNPATFAAGRDTARCSGGGGGAGELLTCSCEDSSGCY